MRNLKILKLSFNIFELIIWKSIIKLQTDVFLLFLGLIQNFYIFNQTTA